MKIRLASDITIDSAVDGEGLRTVIWTQGCPHHCPGCHNPETHDMTKGLLVDTQDIIDRIRNIELQDGVTFSGGDPMMQPEACAEIASALKASGLNIWCYTGFKFEDLIKSTHHIEFLKQIDVLVDGRFEIDKKSYDCLFRGSTNQRIIDVKKSLRKGAAVEIKKYNKKRQKDLDLALI